MKWSCEENTSSSFPMAILQVLVFTCYSMNQKDHSYTCVDVSFNSVKRHWLNWEFQDETGSSCMLQFWYYSLWKKCCHMHLINTSTMRPLDMRIKSYTLSWYLFQRLVLKSFRMWFLCSLFMWLEFVCVFCGSRYL